MCIAWPMCLTEILPDKFAMADLDGVSRRISLRLLPDAKVGDYVLVHAGYAIEIVDPVKLAEQLKIFEELKNELADNGKQA
ncbi:MAG: HypC/HybG/HupF family hydrogenase formation chaperone [Lentisphaeria bacterium]|nr:HypC/HybG/HupF family hydrogenase formation chaperone [Lentisphaerota bacterium]MBR7145498.1 HypC/HybG/HupF family hydrogenase formation chaperone [Lentisphaeria bacterium]